VLSETLPPGEAAVEMMEALLDLVAPQEPEPPRIAPPRRRPRKKAR
jgi:hypothetical protein